MAYATPEELRAWMELPEPGEDDDTDALLADLLDTASSQVDEHCDRSFTPADAPSPRRYDTLDDGRYVFVDDFVGSATVNGIEATAYPLNPQRGRPYTALKGAFGRHQIIEVVAAWGWPETPEAIVTATLMLAARLWDRRQSPGGVLGTSDIGVIRVTGTDRDVEALLAPYVRARGYMA